VAFRDKYNWATPEYYDTNNLEVEIDTLINEAIARYIRILENRHARSEVMVSSEIVNNGPSASSEQGKKGFKKRC
jgi:hypothetical protein